MKTIFFFISIFSASFLATNAQNRDVEDLKEQELMLIQTYPHYFERARIEKIEKISDKHSKIYYKKDNRNYEAVVNSAQKDFLMLTNAIEIPNAEIPEVVLANFKKGEHGKKPMVKAFLVTTPDDVNLYRIDVKDKNDEVKSLFYNNFGQYARPPY